MEKHVTIYSLAKELGMSPSMVSRAFNPSAIVDAEKRKKILEVADKYNFRPNRYASRLPMPLIRIGVLMGISYCSVADSLCAGVESAYEMLKDLKIEYSVIHVPPEKRNPKDCEVFLQTFAGYDGVIVSGFSSDEYIPVLTAFAKKNSNLVFLQSVNNAVPHLFSSKHDEQTASMLAAEFLHCCLRRMPESERKVLLFTGKNSNQLHKNAAEYFRMGCSVYGLQLLDVIDMQDSDNVLSEQLPNIFSRFPISSVKGIYFTSGNSASLCKYLEKEHYTGDLVTFDLYSDHRRYLESGLITATIYQNLEEQGRKAFSMLVQSVVSGIKPPKTVYTDVALILKNNLSSVQN